MYHLGNMEYFDFNMRELYDAIDNNGDGSIDFDELCFYICTDLGEAWSALDKAR